MSKFSVSAVALAAAVFRPVALTVTDSRKIRSNRESIIKMTKSSKYSLMKTAVLSAVLILASHSASAATYTETGDAGTGIGGGVNAQSVTGIAGSSITAIKGTLTVSGVGISEADAFKIYISSPSTFSATTTSTVFTPGVNSFDSQLFLFTLGGIGIVGNDDDGSVGAQSTIPAGSSFTSSLAAGYYYLLITGTGQNPASSGGSIFPNWTDNITDPTGVYGPSGPGGAFAFSTFDGGSGEGGAYSIALTGVSIAPDTGLTVPEPSSLALVLSALALMTKSRRRRQ